MSTPQNSGTAEAGNSSATIHARVGDSAIDKVTRLFSAGLADIFTETLQNSRRGGVNRRPKLTPNRRAILTPLSGTAEVVPVVNRGDPSGFV